MASCLQGINLSSEFQKALSNDCIKHIGSRSYILREALADYDYTKGALVVIPAHTIQPASLYVMEHKKRVMPEAKVEILSCEANGSDMRLVLHSDVFAHHVTIHGDYKFSDNYFDLLPGETREVTVYNTACTDWTVTSIG